MCSRHAASFPMGKLLINCDLGENESDEQTRILIELADAANICCGVHAGNPEKMEATLREAEKRDVMIGAHPGLANAGGRGGDRPSPDNFRVLLEQQLKDFIDCADRVVCTVSYVKLHGSLYHAVEYDEALAEVYLSVLQSTGLDLGVFALSGGKFQEKAKAVGLTVYEEVFADRGYRANGSLVPRADDGALLNVESAIARFRHWQRSGLMKTADGELITLQADTICIHSDSPGSEQLLKQLQFLNGSLD